MTRSETAPPESLSSQELSWNRQKSFWTRVNFDVTAGLHPLKISDGFDLAVEVAVKRLEELSEEIKFDKSEY